MPGCVQSLRRLCKMDHQVLANQASKVGGLLSSLQRYTAETGD